MKKIVFVFVCALIVSVTGFAQQRGGTPQEMANRQTEWMKTELKLTAEQVTQVEAINLSIAKERAAMMEKAGGDFGSIRDDMQKLNEKTEAELTKVLTQEQLEAYKKQAAQRRGPGGGGNR